MCVSVTYVYMNNNNAVLGSVATPHSKSKENDLKTKIEDQIRQEHLAKRH